MAEADSSDAQTDGLVPIHAQVCLHVRIDASRAKPCKVGIATTVQRKSGKGTSQKYIQIVGTYSQPELEIVLSDCLSRDSSDFSVNGYAINQIQEHLLSKGFTIAPNSKKLMRILAKVPEQTLCSLSDSKIIPELYSAEIVMASIAQLKSVLPGHSTILGLFKARFRNPKQSASIIHKDDIRITEHDVRLALFPTHCACTPTSREGIFDRYRAFRDEIHCAFPKLHLPEAIDGSHSCSSEDVLNFTMDILDAIQAYNQGTNSCGDELVFSNINVWIPLDSKQLTFLPLADSTNIPYPLDADAVERVTSCMHKLEAFERNNALIFFGQCVLHQALIGEGIAFGSGSLEGRYLVLTPRRNTHSGSLRICIGSGASHGSQEASEHNQHHVSED